MEELPRRMEKLPRRMVEVAEVEKKEEREQEKNIIFEVRNHLDWVLKGVEKEIEKKKGKISAKEWEKLKKEKEEIFKVKEDFLNGKVTKEFFKVIKNYPSEIEEKVKELKRWPKEMLKKIREGIKKSYIYDTYERIYKLEKKEFFDREWPSLCKEILAKARERKKEWQRIIKDLKPEEIQKIFPEINELEKTPFMKEREEEIEKAGKGYIFWFGKKFW